jgi:flagellar biosynthesis chaperone FliJ
MNNRLEQLKDLEVQLHEVNQELRRAARPLGRLSDLNLEQREQVAAQLRSGFARWGSVTHQILQALGTGIAPDVSLLTYTEGGSR